MHTLHIIMDAERLLEARGRTILGTLHGEALLSLQLRAVVGSSLSLLEPLKEPLMVFPSGPDTVGPPREAVRSIPWSGDACTVLRTQNPLTPRRLRRSLRMSRHLFSFSSFFPVPASILLAAIPSTINIASILDWYGVMGPLSARRPSALSPRPLTTFAYC